MSQHIFESKDSAGRNVQVILGWDRPLQQFFLVVENLDAASDDGEDDYLYSNHGDMDAFNVQDINFFVDKLAAFGICAPKALISEVCADRQNNVGNRQVVYDAHGTMG
jgi:hypothetical protein